MIIMTSINDLKQKLKTLTSKWHYLKTETDAKFITNETLNSFADYISNTLIPGKIVDNLTSTNSSVMLSAKQGKVLNDNKEDKSNKSSNITADTGSTTKYPTVKAVEDYAQPIGNYLTSHQSLDSKTVTIEKQSTAETGYTATYVLKQGGTALSPKINIPKDYLVKSASLETVGSTPTTLESANSLITGDKYLKFVVNTQENDDITNLIIPVNDLVDTYDADGTTIELNNGVFSVKSNVFADKSHTHSQYLTSHQDISGKEDTSNKVTSLSSSSTDTQYPSAKVVYDSLNSKVDKNVGTFTELQAIIDNASANDIVVLEKDYKNTGNESAINITKALNIDGNGHTLDANNSSGIISSTNQLSILHISDIVFMNANTSAILTSNYLYCYFCTFINNDVTGDGGAINTTKTIYIYNCGFINNSATDNGSSIYSTSTGEINDSFFMPKNLQVYTTSTNTNKIKAINTNLYTGSNEITAATYLNSNTNHSSTSDTYGVGTATSYGHNKVINHLATASYANGESLSAYQGKVLKGLVDGKANTTHSHQQYFEKQNTLPLFSQILNSNITLGDIIDWHAEDDGYPTRTDFLNIFDITDFDSYIHNYAGSITDDVYYYLEAVYNYNANLFDADYLTDHCYYIYDDVWNNDYHLIRNYGEGVGFYYYGVVDYLNVPVDNLTTNDSTKTLSAKQGKILNDKIGDILTIINGTGGGS